MFKVIITDAVISKGYSGTAALRYNDNKSAVQFKIGKRVYDKTAKDSHRYINIVVKTFGQLCERAEKMQLKESSRINICGRLDEEQREENGQKFSRFVVIAEDIEYASSVSDGGKSNGIGANNSAPQFQNGQTSAPQNSEPPPPVQQQNSQNQSSQTGVPSNFSGYDSFSGENVFF